MQTYYCKPQEICCYLQESVVICRNLVKYCNMQESVVIYRKKDRN